MDILYYKIGNTGMLLLFIFSILLLVSKLLIRVKNYKWEMVLTFYYDMIYTQRINSPNIFLYI